MKIIVLMGGTSPEREVSLRSGEAIYRACLAAGYETTRLVLEADPAPHVPVLRDCDLVFNALHGGQGENGVVQGFLDLIDVRYTGSGPLASALCMDKNISKQLVRAAGWDTADWLCRPSGCDEPVVWDSYPVVVKPNDAGSTIGLRIVHRPEELVPALAEAGKYSPEVLVERYIPGRELTVALLGDAVLPVVEIVPSHESYDYECKYTGGMSVYHCPADLPHPLTENLQNAAREIFRLLRCVHYARIDFRLDPDGRFWFLEANTLPGMTATSLVPKAAQAVGLSFADLIKRIVELAADA